MSLTVQSRILMGMFLGDIYMFIIFHFRQWFHSVLLWEKKKISVDAQFQLALDVWLYIRHILKCYIKYFPSFTCSLGIEKA